MAKHATTRTITPASPIPDKLYFRIGEAARLCGVEAYVLRFWETEFPQLKVNKGGTGQRLYRRRDVELALRIKQLLHHEGYTIAGARQHLAQEAKEGRRKTQPQPVLPIAVPPGKAAAQQAHVNAKLQQLRKELKDLLNVLSTEPKSSSVASAPPVRTHHSTRRERNPGPTLFE